MFLYIGIENLDQAEQMFSAYAKTTFSYMCAVLDTSIDKQMDLFKFREKYDKELRCLNIKG